MNKGKISAKDLINVGLYSFIYSVLALLVGMLGFIPIFIPLMVIICPIIGGIPYMLYITKVRKFGMITLMGLLVGIIMFITGMGYWTVFVGTISGLIADLILRAGNYKKANLAILSSGFFSIWVFGNLMPFYINRANFLAILSEGYGAEYAKLLESYLPMWTLPVLLVLSFICGLIGGYLGKIISKKHFERAGII